MELVCRRTQTFTIIDQKKHNIYNNDYRIYYVNIDLRHLYGADIPPGKMYMAARSKEKCLYLQAIQNATCNKVLN